MHNLPIFDGIFPTACIIQVGTSCALDKVLNVSGLEVSTGAAVRARLELVERKAERYE